MKVYIYSSILIIFVILIVGAWGLLSFMTSPALKTKETIFFEVPSGVSLNQVAQQLYQKKLITSPTKFKIVSYLVKVSTKMKAGEYELHTQMSPVNILKILASGKSREYSITLQEGANMYEVAEIFQKKGLGDKSQFLSLCQDRQLIHSLLGQEIDSLEGYLFPETYFLTKKQEPDPLLK